MKVVWSLSETQAMYKTDQKFLSCIKETLLEMVVKVAVMK